MATSNSASQKIQKPSWQYDYSGGQLQDAYSINKADDEVDPESLQPYNSGPQQPAYGPQNQFWEVEDPQIIENEMMAKNHLFDSHCNNAQNIAFKLK